MKRIVPFLLMLSLVPVITGCDKSDEVPPVTDTLPTGYRLPDPQTLSDRRGDGIQQQHEIIEVRKYRSPEVQKSGSPEVQKYRSTEVRKSSHMHKHLIIGYYHCNDWTSELLDF